MRRIISVQPSSSTNNNNNNEKIINNNNNTIRSLSPNNIGTPSKPPTTPSHIINKKKLIVEKDNLEKLIFSHAATPIENPMKIKVARKFVARIKTEINNKDN